MTQTNSETSPALEERRGRIHTAINNYLDNEVFRPQFLPDFVNAHTALQRLIRVRSGTYDIEQTIQDLNNVALNERLPPLTHLAGLSTLQQLIQTPTGQEYAQPLIEVQNNFATLADRLRRIDTSKFGTRKNTAWDAQLMLASLANLDPTAAAVNAEDENPNARLNLTIISELLRTKQLRLFFPGLDTVSISSDEEHIVDNPIFPDSTIILSRGKLADIEKMQQAVILGRPEKNKKTRQIEFVRSLPGAIVAIQHQTRTSLTETGVEKRTSKMTSVFLPTLDKPRTDPQTIFEKANGHTDREIINAHVINSLVFYGTKHMIRDILKARRRTHSLTTETPLVDKNDLLKYAQRILDREFKREIEHDQLPDGKSSVLDKAIEEYSQSMFAEEWDRQAIETSLVHSFACVGASFDESTQRYRLRTEEEVENLTIQQTLTDIPFTRLIELANIFKNRDGSYDHLTEAQSEYVFDEQVRNQIQNLIDGKEDPSIETEENTQRLQRYLSNILQVRFLTIRNRSVEGVITGKDKDDITKW